jgi:hypothetical protein
MRRLWAGTLVGVLLAITAAAGPAAACGCGAVAPAVGTTAQSTSESAILSLVGGVQTTQLSLGFDSAVPTAGLVVPTPTPATVAAGDPALFDAVDRQTAPEPRYVDDWWGVAPPTEAEPKVLSRIRVGALEAVTLDADDSAGLGGWLSANGYELPAEAAGMLGEYVDRDWFFVAVKLANDATLDGTLQPIQFSFATDHLVYPAGLTRAVAGEQSMRLSVFGEHRTEVVRSGTRDPLNAAVRTVWAGPVTDAALAPLGAYLTVTDVRFEQPTVQGATDIGFATGPHDEPVRSTVMVVRPVELLGFPLGSLLAVWGGIGLVFLVAIGVARSRPR